MSRKKKKQDLHVGFTTMTRPGKLGVAITRPHSDDECEAAVADAQRALAESAPDDEPEGETVYEASDAKTSVGYSKAYAANYDKVFGSN